MLKKVCKDRGMVVISQEEQELKIWEVISLRDELGHGGVEVTWLRIWENILEARSQYLVVWKWLWRDSC